MLYNYNQLIDKISKASGLTVNDIDRRVEAKCAKLSGLISKEGAAQIVASELGISFEKEKMKVAELLGGMRKVNIAGKVIQEPIIREFTTKSGVKSKVLSTSLADETGNVRTVLWDTNHIKLFEDGKLKNGDSIEVGNASIRNDELHLGSFSEIKLSNEKFDNIITNKKTIEKKISELKSGDNVRLRAVIVQVFEPRFFETCPECNKKAVERRCAEHGEVMPVKKAVLSIVLDDGTESIRGAVFGDQIKILDLTNDDLASEELFTLKKQEILGKEAFFVGNARMNKVFNTMDLVINDIEEINLDNLIQSLKS